MTVMKGIPRVASDAAECIVAIEDLDDDDYLTFIAIC
jgi:hypothetical protein